MIFGWRPAFDSWAEHLAEIPLVEPRNPPYVIVVNLHQTVIARTLLVILTGMCGGPGVSHFDGVCDELAFSWSRATFLATVKWGRKPAMDMLLSNSKRQQSTEIAPADFVVIRNALMELNEVRLFHESFATWQAPTSASQHRKSHRVSVDYPLQITSLDGERGPKIEARSRDLSPYGISFHCQESLPFRRVLVEFSGTNIPTLVSELTWCRFTREQLHLCGGSFIGIYTGDA